MLGLRSTPISTIFFTKIESSRQLVQFKNGTELGVPDDEYNKSPWREGCSQTVSYLIL